jgi:hypothetical protein
MKRSIEAAIAFVFLLFNAAYLYEALALPKSPLPGDVGPAQLPVAIAILGMVLAALYLVQSLAGRAADVGAVSLKVPAFVAMAVAAAILTPWIGMALMLAIFSAAGVILLDSRRATATGIITGVAVFAIAYGGFGWLLDLPLP